MQDEQQPDLVGLSAEIVSAYVAKNHIQTSEIPQLIASVHGPSGMWQSLRLSPRSMSRRCLSTRRSDPTTSSALRTAVQIAEAPSVEPRPHPGAVSKEVGFTTRLSDGRGQLRQDSITVGKGDWPRPKAEGEASGQEGFRRLKL